MALASRRWVGCNCRAPSRGIGRAPELGGPMARPLGGEPLGVNACPRADASCVAGSAMDDGGLVRSALERAERALDADRAGACRARQQRRRPRPRRAAARQGARSGRRARPADPRRRRRPMAEVDLTIAGRPYRVACRERRGRQPARRRARWSTPRAARRWPGSARCPKRANCCSPRCCWPTSWSTSSRPQAAAPAAARPGAGRSAPKRSPTGSKRSPTPLRARAPSA